METVYRFIDDHAESTVGQLIEFCHQPSISAHGKGLQSWRPRCVNWASQQD